jgi:hypothetical protein
MHLHAVNWHRLGFLSCWLNAVATLALISSDRTSGQLTSRSSAEVLAFVNINAQVQAVACSLH